MKKIRIAADMRRAMAVAALSVCVCTASAGIVKGMIKDRQNGEPLTGATVMAAESGKGATADIDGSYMLELPAGTYTMTVRYVGYKTIVKNGVKVAGEGETVLDFLMESLSLIHI